MKKKTTRGIKEAAKLVFSCFLVATFIYTFSLLQGHLAYHNFKNGVEAGVEAGLGLCGRSGGTLPKGDMRTNTLGSEESEPASLDTGHSS